MNVRAKPQIDMLQLDGLVTTKVDSTSRANETFIYARALGTQRNCPHCAPEETTVHGHGLDVGQFKDVTFGGRMTTIVAQRQRFRCTACAKTWTERVPSLHERRMMSVRLEEHVAKKCFVATFMDVGREFGLDEGTVRSIFGDYAAERERTHRFVTPRILGIDEIHLNEVPCVLVDVARHRIFDILPSRTKVNVAAYLTDLEDKENVEVVVADMWRGYHALAEEFFPGRLVVVDKFHFLRMAHNGLDDIRKACGRSRSQEDKIRLKDERHLLHRRRAKLKTGEQAKVDAWLRAFPLLDEAYKAKERMTDAYDAPNRREGERAIARSLQAMPRAIDQAFNEMTTAYANWRTPILNYFEEPATNAYTESVNSLIRELDRVGRGYSFDTMRALMLYDETVRTKKTSTRRDRPPIPDDAFGFIDFDGFSDPWSVAEERSEADGGPDIRRLLARLALDPTFKVAIDEE